MSNISAIILAAGASTRMGRQKVLMPWGDYPTMGECSIARIAESAPAEMVIVTSKETHPYFSERFENVVLNAHSVLGMTSSIQAGVRATSDDSDGFMICLADMPLITSATYRLLMDRFGTLGKSGIIQPVYEGRPGQPVIFSAAYRAEILRHVPPEGCREIVRDNALSLVRLEVKDPGIHVDIDDSDAYDRYST